LASDHYHIHYHRYHHLPINKMSLYEHAHELNPPRLKYDPAMDVPEPPTPRRKPPFKTHYTQHGQIHVLHGETRLYTGRYTVSGRTAKYAAIGIKYARDEPSIQCDRKSAAQMLRTLRNKNIC
jgi:hypothetical protein